MVDLFDTETVRKAFAERDTFRARVAELEAALQDAWDVIDAGVYGPGDVCDLSIRIRKVLDGDTE